MNSMKKRIIRVVPLNDMAKDHQAEDRSVTSNKSSRSRSSRTSRIRLRRSSSKNSINSKNSNNDNSNSKRQQQQQQFSKRPYLYKSAGEHSPTKQTRLHFNNLITDKNNNYNIKNNKHESNPVHWIDWIDSGMDLFGCGIAANANNTDEVLSSSSTADTADKSNSTTNSNTNNNDNSNTNTNTNTNTHNQSNHPRHHNNKQLIRDDNENIAAAIKKRHKELMEYDYMQLHEDFFDSLLKEEGDQMLASILAAAAAIEENEKGGAGVGVGRSGSSSFSVTSASGVSASAAMSTTSKSSGITADETTIHSIKSNKSPSLSSTRTVRMNRCLGSFGKKKRQRRGSTTTNIEEYDQLYNPDLLTNNKDNNNNNNNASKASIRSVPVTSVLCIQDIMAKDHLETPRHYVHPKCRLQKDKGRGERLESSISATGRESCLVKLRDKMKLIVEVSGELHSNSATSFNNNDDTASVTSASSTSNNNTNSSENNNNNSKAMSAGMKRRRAKIASIEKNTNYCEGRDDGSCVIETRSMIELQLGFLSMQYGLLLRWDAYRTGRIVYVCLRKMCHDSFYTKIPSIPITTTTTTTKTETGTTRTTNNNSQSSSSLQQQRIKLKQQYPVPSSSGFDDNGSNGIPRIIAATKKREVSSPLVVRSRKGGNHAIYQRSSGATEVILVDAPYRVPQPDFFAPSVLTLDIHQLTGLDPKSLWTLSMTFNGHTEIAHLKYNHQERVFETTRTTPCKWEMIMVPNRPVTSFDVATGLEIRLFEQRPKQGFRGVVSVGGIVGRSSFSSSSSLVPPGRDSFSLNSPSSSYVIQNQRLIHYNVNKNGKFSSSEGSLVSSNSGGCGGSTSSRNSSKKSTSRLASTMTVPLGGLVSQPSKSQTALWKLTIPFTHNQNSMVNLTLKHQSDYAHWLYRELRARRKEELALSSSASAYSLAGGESRSGPGLWRRFISPTNSNNNNEDDDLDETDLYCMDWIYCC
jgi:hypothetical protein